MTRKKTKVTGDIFECLFCDEPVVIKDRNYILPDDPIWCEKCGNKMRMTVTVKEIEVRTHI